MGSVKDLNMLSPAFENKQGIGEFNFSDRYSVFDWGEMPDHIKNKGQALAVMSAFNFEKLEERGVRTHYKRLVTSDKKLIRFSDIEELSNGASVMQVNMAIKYYPVAR